MHLTLSAIAHYLDTCLDSSRFPDDQNGIYHSTNHPIKRIGLAIEPWSGIATWINDKQLDALFLHRPWQLNKANLPDHTGIVAYHLAFDLTLTLGFNQRLAATLDMSRLQPCAFKNGIALGMQGKIPVCTINTLRANLTVIFDRPPQIMQQTIETVERIAVVGAMTDKLIREAANDGVQVYITGQFRQPARKAVQETGIAVAEISHASCELWGLKALADILQERWSDLEVLLAPYNHSNKEEAWS